MALLNCCCCVIVVAVWFVLASNSPATCLCLSLLSCCLTAAYTVYKLSSRFGGYSPFLAYTLQLCCVDTTVDSAGI